MIEEVLTKDIACSMKKVKEKIEKKTNIYYIDHLLIRELDGLIKSEIEWEEKKQIENENKITNKNK